MARCEVKSKRRLLVSVLFLSGLYPTLSSSAKSKSKNPYDERRLLEQNKRRQRDNNAPEDFPNFIREGQLLVFSMSHRVKQHCFSLKTTFGVAICLIFVFFLRKNS